MICEANGLTDSELINHLFTNELDPVNITVQGQNVKVVESFRRIKRVIKRELLKANYGNE